MINIANIVDRLREIMDDDMLKSAEISHEIEAEKQDVDKLLVEIREAKETLLKIQQDLQNVIKVEDDV